MNRVRSLAITMLISVNLCVQGADIKYITSNEVITPSLSEGALIRKDPGFETDFLVLHCLIKQFQPAKIFEVGTCEGYGTLIMSHAFPKSSIISLDLPAGSQPFCLKLSDIGWRCNIPYTQVFGDSLTYNYSQHFPIDAWFLDGAHDYKHVKHETEQAVKSQAKLIVYHDTDIDEVFEAIKDALANAEYVIYRITDTRVSYAIKK